MNISAADEGPRHVVNQFDHQIASPVMAREIKFRSIAEDTESVDSFDLECEGMANDLEKSNDPAIRVDDPTDFVRQLPLSGKMKVKLYGQAITKTKPSICSQFDD